MSRFTLILGGTLVGAGIALIGAGTWRHRADERLMSTAATASGLVVAKESTSSSDGSKSDYFVRYRFTAGDGRSFEGRARIDRRRWLSYTEGMPIAVTYLPAQPSNNRLPEARSTALYTIFWIAGGAFVLAGAGVLGFAVFERRRRRARRAFVVHRRGSRR